MKIILVDDEKTILTTLGDALADAGHDVVRISTGQDALKHIQKESFDVLITDLRLPGTDGLTLVRTAREFHPDAVPIIITGYGTFQNAVEAMELGVRDFLSKPFLNEDIIARIERIEEVRRLSRENTRLKRELGRKYQLDKLVGRSEIMQELFDTITQIAGNDFSVLITGESGTGKELVARALHHLSPRKNNQLIPLSCATLPENLLEDELFGHEPGAFTDARKRKIGRFEQAHLGSIFLDDIDDMPLVTQVKLLRVLQERQFERLGGTKTIEIDVRVIAATKINLAERVEEGRFREDLFYRLNVLPLNVPPLRQRPDDIPILIDHFIEKYSPDRPFEVAADTLRAMVGYSWPGNIRELENAVKRAIAMAADDEVFLNRKYLLAGTPLAELAAKSTPHLSAAATAGSDTFPSLKDITRMTEAEHIRQALQSAGGNRTRAAELLRISRKNLWEKMREYGIE